MGIANQSLLRTGPIVAGLLDALRALTYDQDGVPKAAFEAVEAFDLTDLVEALQRLVAARDRVCLVIYDGTSLESRVAGQALYTGSVRRFTLVVADRNFGDRMTAFIGSDSSPGAYLLADRVVEEFRGQITGIDGCWWEPTDIEPMSIEGQVRDELVGRGAMLVQLRCHGGEAMASNGQRTY